MKKRVVKNTVKNKFIVLDGKAERVAKRLLGCILERKIGSKVIRVKIVETESYGERDPASHSYRGETKRNKVMFGKSGHLYVYFTYGMHYCANIVVGKKSRGEAVLLRAVEPISGEETMVKNRGGIVGKSLCNGPAKLCKALGIEIELNGHNLASPPLKLIIKDRIKKSRIIQTTRIGITKNKEALLRFHYHTQGYPV